MWMKRIWAAAGIAMAGAVTAQADEITIAGYEYKNVLITQTSSFYYVQLPEEGRTLSIPVGEVQATAVKINKDPFYRTPLKTKYDENRQRRAAGEIKDVDPAFKAPANPAADGAAVAAAPGGGGGGGGGGGLGVPRTQVEGALAGFGFTVEPGPTSAMATNPMGISIEMIGPPESLNALVVKANGPVAVVDQGAQQMQMFLMTLNPEAGAAYGKVLTEAKANGSASGGAGNIKINVTRQVNGDTATGEIRVSAN